MRDKPIICSGNGITFDKCGDEATHLGERCGVRVRTCEKHIAGADNARLERAPSDHPEAG